MRRASIGGGIVVLLLVALWWLWRGAAARPEGPAEVGVEVAGGLTGPRGRPELELAKFVRAGASVSGTVRDPQGQGVAGARVCAIGTSRLLTTDQHEWVCADSGRDGRYRIDDLFTGRHKVTAMAPRYVPTYFARGEGAARRDEVQLRAGQETTGVDITLQPGGVEVTGVVRDLSGGAVEGARVVAGAFASGGGRSVGASGPEGEFSLWVRPGETHLFASAEGYAEQQDHGPAPGHHFELFMTPESVLIGRVVRASDGSPVAGATVSVSHVTVSTSASGEFRAAGLLPGSYKPEAVADDAYGQAAEAVLLGLGETSAEVVITTHPTFFVEGTVVADGAPCEAGSVGLHDRTAKRSRSATIEADGVVRVLALQPGSHEVYVSCKGFVPAESYPAVVIAESSVTGLRWDLTRGRSIRGVVVDLGGRSVEDVALRAYPRGEPARLTAVYDQPVDAGGRFELPGLLPGTYEVTLRRAHRAIEGVMQVVELAEGRDVEGVRLELPAGGEVRGSVRDSGGRPVARAQLRLAGEHGREVTASDEGRFEFAGVAVGEYRLTALRGDEVLRAPGTGDDDVQGVKLAVRAGGVETVELVVEGASGRISGVVRDPDGGAVADAFIDAAREPESAAAAAGEAMHHRWRSYGERPRLTDADGRFVVDGLVPGRYALRAQRRGGGEAIVEHAELGSDVVVKFAEVGRVAGALGLDGGAAPEEFTVALHDASTGYGREERFYRTGGAWGFAEVPAGRYDLVFKAARGSQKLSVPLAAGEQRTDLKVVMAGRVTVRGTVVDLAGEPAVGVKVAINETLSFWFNEGGAHISDAAGRFTVEDAPTGAVYLRAEHPEGTFELRQMPLRLAGERAEVELPPIQVVRSRIAEGRAPGDLGYVVKRSEVGEEQLRARQVVAVVRPGGPAARAGLQVGDEIVAIDGQSVIDEYAGMHDSLTRVPAGTVVRCTVARGVTLEIKAGKRP